MAIRRAAISKPMAPGFCAVAFAALLSPPVAAIPFSFSTGSVTNSIFPIAGAVAEPSTLLLIGVALVAVALYRPRKDHSRKDPGEPNVPPSQARRP